MGEGDTVASIGIVLPEEEQDKTESEESKKWLKQRTGN
jgi:hypothetical protein